MRAYTAHINRADRSRTFVLVKEGFAWGAFFFTFVWALWHRMWFWAAVMFCLVLIVGGTTQAMGLDPAAGFVVTLGVDVLIGFVANDLRRRTLTARGYDEVSVVTGETLLAAETRFLEAAQKQGMEFGV